MNDFLKKLKERNRLLYWFGWCNLAVAFTLLLLMQLDNFEILGVSRWLKPMKFYSTVWILAWTLGWLMHYLSNKKIVAVFTWFSIVTMVLENGLILMQAIRKTTSHFNIRTNFDGLVFAGMGITIGIFTITVLFILLAFFVQKKFAISNAYLWGIRFGLIIFLLASFEGGYMASILRHSVGGADGGTGMPIVNWSMKYGDLRIAHFFGIHALQLLPFFGWLTEKKKYSIFIISLIYFLVLWLMLSLALSGKMLF